jgi:mannose-1-phosphate guanylyltransferase
MLDRIALGVPSSIERDVFPAVAAEGKLFGVPTDDYWTDTGRPELYVRANLDLLDGVRQIACEAIAPGATVDPTAVVEHSVVGDDVTVGAEATVVDSVLLPGARVGAGAVVRSSAVRGRVDAGEVVTGALIGATR